MYYRPEKNNPLFIPECERSNPGKAWYAFAECDALGFGPFGIESLVSDVAYSQSYRGVEGNVANNGRLSGYRGK